MSLNLEEQKLFEKFAGTPNREGDGRVDLHTCSYCHKISEQELKFCAKCKKLFIAIVNARTNPGRHTRRFALNLMLIGLR